MKEGEIWVALTNLGCKILYERSIGESFQEVEFCVSPATDIVELLNTLRKYNFYEMRFDTTTDGVVIGSRTLY